MRSARRRPRRARRRPRRRTRPAGGRPRRPTAQMRASAPWMEARSRSSSPATAAASTWCTVRTTGPAPPRGRSRRSASPAMASWACSTSAGSSAASAPARAATAAPARSSGPRPGARHGDAAHPGAGRALEDGPRRRGRPHLGVVAERPASPSATARAWTTAPDRLRGPADETHPHRGIVAGGRLPSPAHVRSGDGPRDRRPRRRPGRRAGARARCSRRSAPRSPSGTPLVGVAGDPLLPGRPRPRPGARPRTRSSVLPGNRGVQLYDSPIAWAPMVAGEQVLDLGCGSGGATRAAARAVGPEGMVVGIDSSPECVAEAQARTPERPARCSSAAATSRRMGNVPDRTFDCVVASLVLEQVADLRPRRPEIFRVLRPGGRMVATRHGLRPPAPDRRLVHGRRDRRRRAAAPRARSPAAPAAPACPHEPRDQRAFDEAGMATVEEQDVQFAVVMEDARRRLGGLLAHLHRPRARRGGPRGAAPRAGAAHAAHALPAAALPAQPAAGLGSAAQEPTASSARPRPSAGAVAVLAAPASGRRSRASRRRSARGRRPSR